MAVKSEQPKAQTPSDEPVLASALDGISRQSQFSTIKPAGDIPESNPPTGSQVEEVLGKASKTVKPAAS